MRALTLDEMSAVAGGFLNNNVGSEQIQANLASGGPGGPGGLFGNGGTGGVGNTGTQQQTGDQVTVAKEGGAIAGVYISF